MSGLPSGWTHATIGDVCNYVQRGRSPKYIAKSELPVINQKCVRWWGIDERHLKFVDPSQWSVWTTERFLEVDDVLWNSTGTGTIGRAALFKGLNSASRAVVDSHVTILRPGGATTGEFLHRYIQSPTVQNAIADMQSGTTNQVELNRTEIVETTLALPPLAEQKRIIAKLDALSTQSARARTELSRIETLVSRYKQAVLDQCCDVSRAAVPLIEMVDRTRGVPYGIVQTGKPQREGVPTVRCGDIKNYAVNKSNLKLVDPQVADQYGRTRLVGGEVLIAIRGSIGETCVVDSALIGCNISREVAMIPVSERVSPQFVMYFLRSSRATSFIGANTKGSAQQGINLGDLRNLPIPLLNLEEQHEIVRRIETAFAKIDRLSVEAKRALKLLGRLDEVILAKAFRGELVPQCENDEPAEKLVERISAERGATLKAKRGRSKQHDDTL
jgi:type I restriction enzyme S subunit